MALIPLLAGCYALQPSDHLTPFPAPGYVLRHKADPIVSYDTNTQHYVVTKEMVDASVRNRFFIEEVLMWKRDNGIR